MYIIDTKKSQQIIVDKEIGCYEDNQLDEDLPNEMSLVSNLITKTSCKLRCLTHKKSNDEFGYKYAGIQIDGVKN